ncbi:glutathione S-transferase theta-2B isoform X1 [Pipistrellus kuhlii]|uniref:glutathione transferase n=1 Tax=Pipistrellus kuhlii TaxID=59472 RepID=A0A7J7RGL2_PIPKU|nr:glutathione S-transferase theta-2B isoform X1 [Pipistrellus kuhlii]KAF6275258.1 glutathione S-transferase theta 2B [Pipistrellus kuhlii]
MGLELYLDLLSQPCRAVYIFAKKIGVPFELRPVELLKGQHLQGFLPAGSPQVVPILKDGDFILHQSVAILIYLSCKYQAADHWYPADLQARARVHEYLGWHADFIRGTFGVSLWTQVLAPHIGAPVPEEKVTRNRAAVDSALQQLEEQVLGDKAFLAGPQLTLADLLALEELMQVVAMGRDVFAGRPRLAAWRGRVEAVLGADLCREAHGPILNVLAQAASKQLPQPPAEFRHWMLLRLSRIP